MHRNPSAARGAVALLACCVAWFACAPAPVPAQAEDKPSLFLSADKQQGAVPLEEVILLRPNADQEVYLWVRNPTGDRRYFHLVVSAGDDVLAKHQFDVQAKSTVRVPLPKQTRPPEPKPEEKKPEEKKPEPGKADEKPPEPIAKIDLPEIKTPKLLFRMSETDKDGKVFTTPGKDPIATRTMAVRVMAPQEYLQATAFNDTTGEGVTTVTVKANANFSGPPCPLTLAFRPDLLPGLKESSTQNGVFKQTVDRAGKEVRLVARKIEFQQSPSLTRTGLIAVGADGYERAFLFAADYDVGSASKSFGEPRKPAVRVRGAQPDGEGKIRLLSLPVDALKFPIEVDYAPAGAWVEVAIDRDGDGEFSEAETVKLPGARDEHIYFSPYGRDGGLLFKSTIKDWTPLVDTAGVLAEHGVRVRVMVSGLKPGDEPKTLVEVKGKLMFDSTPPEGIKFGDFPKEVVKGSRLPLKVRARDEESGIVRVNFFLGELKDGKLPDGLPAIKAISPRDADDWWTAEIPAPDKKGEFTVIAQVTNGVGLVALADTKVELTDPPPPVGSIKGKVTEADRPQPKLTVTLRSKAPKDPAKKQQDTWTTTTNEKGEFEFEDLPPGDYVASSTKGTGKAKRQGSKTVEVKAKKTAEVEVSLTTP